MISLEIVDYFALAALVLSSLVYIGTASPESGNKTADWYFFDSRKANGKTYGASMAAASTSLATVVIFFITGVNQYGLFLLWCGITYMAGQIIYLRIMHRIKLETGHLTTISDFWFDNCGGRASARIISFLGLIAFTFILFLELYVGSEIITYYVRGKNEYLFFGAYLFLLLVVAIYVMIGGIHAVLKSDVWQYMLMLFAVACMAVVALLYEPDPPAKSSRVPAIGSSDVELGLFLVWVTIQNLTLPFTQLSSWQRLASTSSLGTAWEGLKKTLFGFSVLWFVPVLAVLYLNMKGQSFDSVAEYFDFLRGSDNLIIYVVYAIIFVGFASALFSTADTAMMGCMLSVVDKNTLGEFIATQDQKNVPVISAIFIVLLILVEVLLYVIFHSQVGRSFLSVVYIIFAQLSIMAPQMIYVLYRRAMHVPLKNLDGWGDIVNAFGMLSAWVVLMAMNFAGAAWGYSQTLSTIYGSFAAMAISGVFFAMALVASEYATHSVRRVAA